MSPKMLNTSISFNSTSGVCTLLHFLCVKCILHIFHHTITPEHTWLVMSSTAGLRQYHRHRHDDVIKWKHFPRWVNNGEAHYDVTAMYNPTQWVTVYPVKNGRGRIVLWFVVVVSTESRWFVYPYSSGMHDCHQRNPLISRFHSGLGPGWTGLRSADRFTKNHSCVLIFSIIKYE